MRLNLYYISFLCFFLLYSCKNGNALGQNKTTDENRDTIQYFILPSVPPMLTSPEQRADFLVKHYWDNINFADTNYVHHPEVTEQAWADYCDLLNHVPLKIAQQAMRAAIKKTNTSQKMFKYFTDLADKYLYDPNSPMRNEEYYIPVLEEMIVSPNLEKAEKIRPQARLDLAQKNRLGTKALNFEYTLANGTQGNMYQLHADYILLFFSNPGCPACSQTIEDIKNAPIIEQLIQNKKLILLSIYPDEDLDEWHKHMKDFPKDWINAYDKKFVIKEKQLYDIKAIPTLYLLDKNKVVLLKDATATNIEQYLIDHA